MPSNIEFFKDKDDNLAANAFLEEAEVTILFSCLLYYLLSFSTILALSRIHQSETQ